MIDVRFRFFEDPEPKRTRRNLLGCSKVTYAKTLDRLEAELGKLKARDVVIEAGFQLSEIRNDGWPRSGAREKHPAVALHFNKEAMPVAMPSLSYFTYHQNLHAIVLTLEALRKVDLHGVAQQGEQYRGWTALPAKGQSTSTASACETVLLCAGYSDAELPSLRDRMLASADFYAEAYRKAVKQVHPDMQGGNRHRFEELMKASLQLQEHHRA